MKFFIAVSLLAAVCIAQKKGEDDLSDPDLAGNLMKLYMDLKLGDNYVSPHTNLADCVSFNLYTRKNKIFSQELKMGDAKSLSNSNYDPTKPTYIIVHGYLNNLYAPAIQAPKNALLDKYDCNVIGVDWGKMALTRSYPTAAYEVSRVGAYIAEMAKFIASSAGLDFKQTTLVGHSLGAQIVGFAGKNLKGLGLGRITGLDPALPGFAFADSTGRIDESDAQFVDCIHTNGGNLGFLLPICQADYYPNGGQKQPGCPMDRSGTCSHLRSIDLYTESVSTSGKFKAQNCKSLPSERGTRCSRSSALMGEPAQPSFKGIFYVKTNTKSPYAQ